jgi:hypothetical protein
MYLLGVIYRLIYTNFQNIFQDASIVLHCPAKILCGGLAAARVDCDVVSGSVVFDCSRVFYGNVDRALFEVSRRIPARRHCIAYQAVGAL